MSFNRWLLNNSHVTKLNSQDCVSSTSINKADDLVSGKLTVFKTTALNFQLSLCPSASEDVVAMNSLPSAFTIFRALYSLNKILESPP